MAETELKISLPADETARLLAAPVLEGLRLAPRRTETLLSIYQDTPDGALSAARIALRLRKVGRRWVQTVKSGARATGPGLFSQEEYEIPAPGGRLVLDGPDPEGALAAVRDVLDGKVPGPVFETRIRRTVERLRTPDGGEAELAVDVGAVACGTDSTPISEAELELVQGSVAGLYDLARLLFPAGPVRFSSVNKAARGYALLRGEPEAPARARKAGSFTYAPSSPVEQVAAMVLRDCLAQITENLVLVLETELPEGPHQLRIGLRRLRTAVGVFGPALGRAALAPVATRARDLGRVAGRLRDLDVLISEVVPAGAAGADAEARAALLDRLDAARTEVRAAVRAELAGPEATGFLFDLGKLIESRGWLDPADWGQTLRLAAPVAELAGPMLETAYLKVRKRGRRIREKDDEALHELRKTLKTLRYTAEMLEPVHSHDAAKDFVAALRRLQDIFGSRNDAAMAAELLGTPEAPARDDAAAQRAVGWILGTLEERSRADTEALYDRWDAFRKADPYW